MGHHHTWDPNSQLTEHSSAQAPAIVNCRDRNNATST